MTMALIDFEFNVNYCEYRSFQWCNLYYYFAGGTLYIWYIRIKVYFMLCFVRWYKGNVTILKPKYKAAVLHAPISSILRASSFLFLYSIDYFHSYSLLISNLIFILILTISFLVFSFQHIIVKNISTNYLKVSFCL